MIHPTAIVSPGAEIGDGVEIGPYAIVGDGVVLSARCRVGAHAVLEGPAFFGEANRIFPHAALGRAPPDLKYRDERTELRVGARNVFREFLTVHRGTAGGGGVTSIGDDNYLMAYIHVAHDCRVGSRTIFANYAALAGHVEIGDDAILEAFCAVQQFSRVGRHAFIGAMTRCAQDVLPFVKTVGTDVVRTYGVNAIGLRRKGFPEDRIDRLKEIFRRLTGPKWNTSQALEQIETDFPGDEDAAYVVDFVRTAKRGVHK
ncbi:MAG TPA: acyl-ACP--UDP-N-acetylglucosamine O-acyltransferase [Thermoanaerobaculia bacterium]|nr:acyl-ACP--UDP-N-acetylglucosamine O-acyltransferase [Thermoanaerobaculia bacterium]